MNRTPRRRQSTRSRALTEQDQRTIARYTAMFAAEYPTSDQLEPPTDDCTCEPDQPDDKTADDDADEWE